jgi:hypothetical protein
MFPKAAVLSTSVSLSLVTGILDTRLADGILCGSDDRLTEGIFCKKMSSLQLVDIHVV